MTKDTDPHAFFWCSDTTYNVVILHKGRKVARKDDKRRKAVFCEEYAAYSPEELVSVCEDAGYGIGTPDRVRALCESAPRSPVKWRRKTAKESLARLAELGEKLRT